MHTGAMNVAQRSLLFTRDVESLDIKTSQLALSNEHFSIADAFWTKPFT